MTLFSYMLIKMLREDLCGKIEKILVILSSSNRNLVMGFLSIELQTDNAGMIDFLSSTLRLNFSHEIKCRHTISPKKGASQIENGQE